MTCVSEARPFQRPQVFHQQRNHSTVQVHWYLRLQTVWKNFKPVLQFLRLLPRDLTRHSAKQFLFDKPIYLIRQKRSYVVWRMSRTRESWRAGESSLRRLNHGSLFITAKDRRAGTTCQYSRFVMENMKNVSLSELPWRKTGPLKALSTPSTVDSADGGWHKKTAF